MQEKQIYAFDFETRYDADYSLKNMPTWAYINDPRFDAYMLSVAGPDGFLWVGHPTKFDWKLFEGAVLVAHNMGFDGLVLKRLQDEGKVPLFAPSEMHCTADMAAFFKLPRALKEIAKFVFGLPDIAVAGANARGKMKTTPVDRLMEDAEIIRYAGNDALLCRRLWMEWSAEWPEPEREISRIGREAGWVGVKIDLDYVSDCAARLQQRLFAAERSIPWTWPEGKTPLSRNKMIAAAFGTADEERAPTDEEADAIGALMLERPDATDADVSKTLNETVWRAPEARCRRVERLWNGDLRIFVWCPASFAKNDEECEAWEDEYGDRFDWIGAVRAWRRHNMLLQKFQHLLKYTDAAGLYRVQLRYCGGHTGRWSGSGFFNVQNLPKAEMFCERGPDGKAIPGTGFDLRRCFLGNFYQVDYNQIEARGLIALVRDERQLPKLRAGMSVYQAHAEATTGRTWGSLKDEDFPLYQAKKMEVLLLGYGGAGKKLARAAYLMTRDSKDPAGVIRWTDDQAQKVVDDYRAANPGIPRFWWAMQRLLEGAVARGQECLKIKLPSGRIMYYWNPRRRTLRKLVEVDGKQTLVEKTEIFTQHMKGSPSSFRRAYGGNMVENLCQAMCRDVLRDAWLALHRAGFHVAFTVHDEFVVDLKPGQTPEQVDKVIIDTGNGSWAAFIPLAVAGKSTPHFAKA